MRTSRTILSMALVGLLMTACQSDDEQITSVIPQDQTAVNFELDASAIKYDIVNNSGLKYSPTYGKDGFKIYAFKRIVGGTDYVYEKTINLTKMTYTPEDKKLRGNDILKIGTYKFLSTYGTEQSGIVSLPTWSSQVALTSDLAMQYNGTSALGEIFLENNDINNLTSYDLGLTNAANPTVTATLGRAVSRVDIMFIKAKKEGDVYTEQKYTAGNNAFGNKTLEQFQLRYKDMNSRMDFFGNLLPATALNANINLSNFSGIITYGDAEGTLVGQDDYTRYDNVQNSDLIYGAAHVFGNYLIPSADGAKDVQLEMYIKPENDEARTITLTEKIPVERNKVTLVKIYIIDNGDGPEEPNVFTTNVKFEVEIETEWNGSNEVTGEIN